MRIVNFYFIQILLKYRLFSFIFEIPLRYFYEKNQSQFTQRTWHENFIHFVRIILYETVSTPYWKWNFTWGWRAPGEPHSALCFYGNFIFFPRGEVHPGEKTGELKSRLLYELVANRRPIVRTDSRGRHIIDRSLSQLVCPTMPSFWHDDSRKLCLRSFSFPEALYRGNAIYRQWSVYAGGKKVHARVYIPRPGTTQR